jgi:putative DNA primase/helicase
MTRASGVKDRAQHRAGQVDVHERTNDPHRLARLFLDPYRSADGLRLRHWRGEFFTWESAYEPLKFDLKARVNRHVREEFERVNREQLRVHAEKNGKAASSPPAILHVTTGLVNNVIAALAGETLLDSRVSAPGWIDGTGPAAVVAARNGLIDLDGLVDLKTIELIPPTPRFFSFNRLDFDFDPAAPKPQRWLEFLGQLFPGDPESIAALQEWCGYSVTPYTDLQKLLLLVGPRRSGKGTIGRILGGLVGRGNAVGPTLGSLADRFGLAPLLNKTLAVIGDARLSGRMDTATVVERLLSITGEDLLTIDRKNLDAVTTKLLTRFVVISNEIPRLTDASSALAGRCILLRLTRSFYGMENTGLTAALLAELPGIFMWALAGWRRLRARGEFLLPASSEELIQEMQDLASPVGTFVRECCLIGPTHQCEPADLFATWQRWSARNGRKDAGMLSTFCRDLRTHCPEISVKRKREGDDRQRVYVGITLAPEIPD